MKKKSIVLLCLFYLMTFPVLLVLAEDSRGTTITNQSSSEVVTYTEGNVLEPVLNRSGRYNRKAQLNFEEFYGSQVTLPLSELFDINGISTVSVEDMEDYQEEWFTTRGLQLVSTNYQGDIEFYPSDASWENNDIEYSFVFLLNETYTHTFEFQLDDGVNMIKMQIYKYSDMDAIVYLYNDGESQVDTQTIHNLDYDKPLYVSYQLNSITDIAMVKAGNIDNIPSGYTVTGDIGTYPTGEIIPKIKFAGGIKSTKFNLLAVDSNYNLEYIRESGENESMIPQFDLNYSINRITELYETTGYSYSSFDYANTFPDITIGNTSDWNVNYQRSNNYLPKELNPDIEQAYQYGSESGDYKQTNMFENNWNAEKEILAIDAANLSSSDCLFYEEQLLGRTSYSLEDRNSSGYARIVESYSDAETIGYVSFSVFKNISTGGVYLTIGDDSSSEGIYIKIDDEILNYDGSNYQKMTDMVYNEWVDIFIKFDTSINYEIWINGQYQGNYNFCNNPVNFNLLNIQTHTVGADYKFSINRVIISENLTDFWNPTGMKENVVDWGSSRYPTFKDLDVSIVYDRGYHVQDYLGHQNVLWLEDKNSSLGTWFTFYGTTDYIQGSASYYLTSNDSSYNCYYVLQDGTTNHIIVRINNDDLFIYDNSISTYHKLLDFVDNQIYKIDIKFDCSIDKYWIYIDNEYKYEGECYLNPDEINGFEVYTDSSDYNYKIMIDAVKLHSEYVDNDIAGNTFWNETITVNEERIEKNGFYWGTTDELFMGSITNDSDSGCYGEIIDNGIHKDVFHIVDTVSGGFGYKAQYELPINEMEAGTIYFEAKYLTSTCYMYVEDGSIGNSFGFEFDAATNDINDYSMGSPTKITDLNQDEWVNISIHFNLATDYLVVQVDDTTYASGEWYGTPTAIDRIHIVTPDVGLCEMWVDNVLISPQVSFELNQLLEALHPNNSTKIGVATSSTDYTMKEITAIMKWNEHTGMNITVGNITTQFIQLKIESDGTLWYYDIEGSWETSGYTFNEQTDYKIGLWIGQKHYQVNVNDSRKIFNRYTEGYELTELNIRMNSSNKPIWLEIDEVAIKNGTQTKWLSGNQRVMAVEARIFDVSLELTGKESIRNTSNFMYGVVFNSPYANFTVSLSFGVFKLEYTCLKMATTFEHNITVDWDGNRTVIQSVYSRNVLNKEILLSIGKSPNSDLPMISSRVGMTESYDGVVSNGTLPKWNTHEPIIEIINKNGAEGGNVQAILEIKGVFQEEYDALENSYDRQYMAQTVNLQKEIESSLEIIFTEPTGLPSDYKYWGFELTNLQIEVGLSNQYYGNSMELTGTTSNATIIIDANETTQYMGLYLYKDEYNQTYSMELNTTYIVFETYSPFTGTFEFSISWEFWFEEKDKTLLEMLTLWLAPILIMIVFPIAFYSVWERKGAVIGFVVGFAVLGFSQLIPVEFAVILVIISLIMAIIVFKKYGSEL